MKLLAFENCDAGSEVFKAFPQYLKARINLMKLSEYVALPCQFFFFFLRYIMDLDTCVEFHSQENLNVFGHLLVCQQVYIQGPSVGLQETAYALSHDLSGSKPPRPDRDIP